MSIENVKLFLEKANQDTVLLEKFRNLPDDMEVALEKGMKLAQEAGFNFTLEEYLQVVSTTGELSDDDLESVTGGAKGLPPGYKWPAIESNPPGF